MLVLSLLYGKQIFCHFRKLPKYNIFQNGGW